MRLILICLFLLTSQITFGHGSRIAILAQQKQQQQQQPFLNRFEQLLGADLIDRIYPDRQLTRCNVPNLVASTEVTPADNFAIRTIPVGSNIVVSFNFSFFSLPVTTVAFQFCKLTVILPLICNTGHITRLTNFTFTLPNQFYVVQANSPATNYQSSSIIIPVVSLCSGGVLSYYNSEIFDFLLGVLTANVSNVVIDGQFSSQLNRPNAANVNANGLLSGNSESDNCGCAPTTAPPTTTTAPPTTTTAPPTTTTAPPTTTTSPPTTTPPPTTSFVCPSGSNLLATNQNTYVFAEFTVLTVTLNITFNTTVPAQDYSIIDLTFLVNYICLGMPVNNTMVIPDHFFNDVTSGTFSYSYNFNVSACNGITVLEYVSIANGNLGSTEPNTLVRFTLNYTVTAGSDIASGTIEETTLSYSYNCAPTMAA